VRDHLSGKNYKCALCSPAADVTLPESRSTGCGILIKQMLCV
jgi:hypothetical protein